MVMQMYVVKVARINIYILKSIFSNILLFVKTDTDNIEVLNKCFA